MTAIDRSVKPAREAAFPHHGKPALLRSINALSALLEVRSGPITATQLSESTGLSRTAADSVLSGLVRQGWLVKTAAPIPPEGSPPGRPAARYAFNAGAGSVVALDIGAHHISAAVADLQGRVIALKTIEADEDAPAADRLESAHALVADTLAEAEVAHGSIALVAVGSPGVINEGRVVHFGGNGMPGWIDTDIQQFFASVFDCHVRVEGDCALGALAEKWIGVAQPFDSVVYVLSGIRTGAAVITEGKLQRGAHGGVGLIGELPELRWREIEDEAYGSGIYRRNRPPRDEVFKRALLNDARARAVVDDFAAVLALGISAMALAVDPDAVVIGGASSPYVHQIRDRIEEDVRRRCPIAPPVLVSTLDSNAVVMGAVRLALVLIEDLLRAAVQAGDPLPSPDALPTLARYQGLRPPRQAASEAIGSY
jgi:predicted NBD/HSP70 family sugar kinase